jgi:hypothetical protein
MRAVFVAELFSRNRATLSILELSLVVLKLESHGNWVLVVDMVAVGVFCW